MNILTHYGYDFNINRTEHIFNSIIHKHYEALYKLTNNCNYNLFVHSKNIPIPIEYIMLSNIVANEDTYISEIVKPILICLSNKMKIINTNSSLTGNYTLSYLITSINHSELLFDALIYDILTIEDMFQQTNNIITMNYKDLLYYLDLLYIKSIERDISIQLSYDDIDPYHHPHNDLITFIIITMYRLTNLESTNIIEVDEVLNKLDDLISSINIKIEEKFINYLCFQYRKIYAVRNGYTSNTKFTQKMMDFSVGLFKIL